MEQTINYYNLLMQKFQRILRMQTCIYLRNRFSPVISWCTSILPVLVVVLVRIQSFFFRKDMMLQQRMDQQNFANWSVHFLG